MLVLTKFIIVNHSFHLCDLVNYRILQSLAIVSFIVLSLLVLLPIKSWYSDNLYGTATKLYGLCVGCNDSLLVGSVCPFIIKHLDTIFTFFLHLFLLSIHPIVTFSKFYWWIRTTFLCTKFIYICIWNKLEYITIYVILVQQYICTTQVCASFSFGSSGTHEQ